MNELDKQALKEATQHDAADDIAGHVNDMIKELSPAQSDDLRIKGQFWFLMGYHKGRLGVPL